MCHRIAREAKKSWDIKAQLIREEQFLWDNLLLSQFYAGNQKYNVLDLLGTAREASVFRYEGAPVRLGLLATWNWYKLRPRLKEQRCVILDFSRPFDIRHRLKEDKASHLLTDGIRSFYVVNSAGAAVSWISLAPGVEVSPGDTWEAVPKAHHHIDNVLMGRDMAISVSRHGEMLLFSRHSAVKWNRDGWHRLVGPSLSALLKDYIPAEAAKRLIEVAVRLSERRQGALFVLTQDTEIMLAAGSRGIGNQFADACLFDLVEVDIETICQVGRIDGAVIINTAGVMVNAGVILHLPDSTRTGQGARTAAAVVASRCGVALKISHDGPISIYRNGTEIRRAG
jgi:hypothetical protein